MMMNVVIKWWGKLKERWEQAKREVDEQTKRENEAWNKWKALPDDSPLKWKHAKNSDSLSSDDGRFWPFGDGGGMA